MCLWHTNATRRYLMTRLATGITTTTQPEYLANVRLGTPALAPQWTLQAPGQADTQPLGNARCNGPARNPIT